ncbi:uncharacterized protein LOC124896219 [Capsicum annuum]|uniref:uncharacterized protein LOC124896219 n=1 Tax=Capsicum annuum TaxID=4072 RepID=UPI001FB0E8B0|nr:uncharacterized protein LOC124896219 [Capsicum annuum]
MVVALRYVNKNGKVNERVIAIVRVADTSVKMLKEKKCSLLIRHSLSTSKILVQGYDWASNMQGEMNAVAKKYLLVDDFFAIITNVLNVLSNCFDVVSDNLLLGMTSLNPANVFANFDKEKIMILDKHYPDEFGIGDLAEALVNANLVETHSLMYLLVKLMLILPVATATIERAFSSMKHIKNELRSSIGDAF